MATRAQWQSRFNKLNRQMCKDGKELEKVMHEMAKINYEQAVVEIILVLFQAYNGLTTPPQMRATGTPIDTGRARAGWQIGSKSSNWKPEDNDDFSRLVAQHLNELNGKFPQLATADKIYLLNNVEYILSLEAGWSKQNAGFIALTLQEMRQQMQQLVEVKTS